MALSFIYVLHFDEPHHHATHYAGCTGNLRVRLETHAKGYGANLTKVLLQNDKTWRLGGLYSCSHAEMRRHEKTIKQYHQSDLFCQICKGAKQHPIKGCQTENINNVPFPTKSEMLRSKEIDLGHVADLEPENEQTGTAFILNLMKKDKDALGFVPVGGVKGIKELVKKRQIAIAYENGEPCGYAFYTIPVIGEKANRQVNIHQCCIDDGARMKGHGAALVAHIQAKHADHEIIAKVRTDLAANHFWTAIGFNVQETKIHKTSGSTIHHYKHEPKEQHK